MKDHQNIIDQYFKAAKQEPVEISIKDIQTLVQGLKPSMPVNSSVLTQSIFKLKYILMLSTSAIVIVGALSIFTLKSEPIEINKTKVLEIEVNDEKQHKQSSLIPLVFADEEQEKDEPKESTETLVQKAEHYILTSESDTEIIEETSPPVLEKEDEVDVSDDFGNWPEIRIDASLNSDDVVLEMNENETRRSAESKLNHTRVFHALKDTSGNKHAALSYDKIYSFGHCQEHWALVKDLGKFGFIDSNGKEVVPLIYNKIYPFRDYQEHWALVKDMGKYGFIDNSGKEVVPPVYDKIYPFADYQEHWALVKDMGKLGFIDNSGNVVIPLIYDKVYPFEHYHESWALVKDLGKLGFIDVSGKEVVPLIYDKIYPFGGFKEDWALVKDLGKFGFIDNEGHEIVAPIYDEVSYFGDYKNGWMKVKIQGKELFIDENGKEINNTSSTQE